MALARDGTDLDLDRAATGDTSSPSQKARTDVDGAFARFNLLGESAAFAEVVRITCRVAPLDATVLIRGETGTGKELIGRAIHYLSPRRDGPFMPLNCGAIPDALVETELFGHARGAFTDAKEARQGVIAQARGGTLFLDELETLTPRGQIALLRFLQEQEYRPVGGVLVRDANVRVVGSTNADLADLAARGQYRQDLLFRLDVLSIEIPPLRARGDDALVLARAFVRRLSDQYRRPAKPLHAEAIAYLKRHSWPGNVRELENVVLRSFLLEDGPELRFAALPASPPGPTCAAPRTGDRGLPLTEANFREAKARAIADFERAYVAELLARASGNIALAARIAGKERSRLGKLIRKYGFSGAAFRSAVAGLDRS
jgi:DNA-binding NtrC family response regulator